MSGPVRLQGSLFCYATFSCVNRTKSKSPEYNFVNKGLRPGFARNEHDQYKKSEKSFAGRFSWTVLPFLMPFGCWNMQKQTSASRNQRAFCLLTQTPVKLLQKIVWSINEDRPHVDVFALITMIVVIQDFVFGKLWDLFGEFVGYPHTNIMHYGHNNTCVCNKACFPAPRLLTGPRHS